MEKNISIYSNKIRKAHKEGGELVTKTNRLKMKILTIDTSSKNAIVAITENEEKIIELNNEEEKTHSQKLMPMIEEAFQKSRLSLDEIELIVCCLGPGSFTGVRIGIATAKAFADSKNIPVVGVNTLEGLAYNIDREGEICSFIDAGHGNTYAGFFKIEKNKELQEDLTFLNLTDETGKLTEKKLMAFIEKNKKQENKPIYFTGNSTSVYAEVFEKLKSQNNCEIVKQKSSLGITLAKIGYNKYKNGEAGDSSILLPIYLRKSQAELALEEKKEKEK